MTLYKTNVAVSCMRTQDAVLYGNLKPLDAGGRKRLIFMLSMSLRCAVSLGRGRDGGGGLVAMATVSGDVEREAEEWSRVERLNSWVPTTQQLTACRNNTGGKP